MMPSSPVDTGKKKIWNYLAGIAEDPEFQKKVRECRSKHDIPLAGHKDIVYDLPFENSTEIKFFRLPEHLVNNDAYFHDVSVLTEKIVLDFMWFDVIGMYVAYNFWEDTSWWGKTFDISDSHSDIDMLSSLTEDVEMYKDYMRVRANSYPVSILVNPYASQRDIIEYIKKNYRRHIFPIQEKYKKEGVKIGVIRKRKSSVRKRNDFIYEHRKLSKKELTSMVAENFGEIMDYTYLAKIIANEEKKRK